MPLLRRRSTADDGVGTVGATSADTAAVDSADEFDETAVASAPKGRPTPKRRDTQVRRGPVTAPKTRKEAAQRQREVRSQQKAGRASAAQPAPQTAAERREALRRGEILAKRDQGKTRKLARDYVDSHRMLSNYLLILFPIMIISYVLPIVQILILAAFFGLLVEWYVTGRRIRAMAVERFGSADGGNMSIGFYAGSRAYLPRRWRLPAPQVQRGDAI